MRKHVVGPVSEVPPGTHKRIEVAGVPVAVFNLDGEFYGLLDK